MLCSAQLAHEGALAEQAHSLQLESQASGQPAELPPVERPVLHRTSRSAFEASHGTRYSLSNHLDDNSGLMTQQAASRSASGNAAAASAPMNEVPVLPNAASPAPAKPCSEPDVPSSTQQPWAPDDDSRACEEQHDAAAESSAGGFATFQQVRKRLAAAHALGLQKAEDSKAMRNGTHPA